MTAPLVSILIPCYNAAPWLRETLESALAQTWSPKEIIVVNDGSTDASLEIARSYGERGVRVIDQPNAGQSAAFNRALREARGKYLEFLDADDVLAPDKIKLQVNRLEALPPGYLATGDWGRFHGTPADASPDPSPVARDLPAVDWLVTLWSRHAMMHGAAWLVPAQLVVDAGGWDERLSLINDFEFFSRLVLASAGVIYVAGAKSCYRSGVPGSLSSSRSEAAWRSAFLSVQLGTARLLAREDSPRTRQACAQCVRGLIFDAYPEAPDLRREAEGWLVRWGEPLGRPPGGPLFTALSRVLGWRLARRLQRHRRTPNK